MPSSAREAWQLCSRSLMARREAMGALSAARMGRGRGLSLGDGERMQEVILRVRLARSVCVRVPHDHPDSPYLKVAMASLGDQLWCGERLPAGGVVGFIRELGHLCYEQQFRKEKRSVPRRLKKKRRRKRMQRKTIQNVLVAEDLAGRNFRWVKPRKFSLDLGIFRPGDLASLRPSCQLIGSCRKFAPEISGVNFQSYFQAGISGARTGISDELGRNIRGKFWKFLALEAATATFQWRL